MVQDHRRYRLPPGSHNPASIRCLKTTCLHQSDLLSIPPPPPLLRPLVYRSVPGPLLHPSPPEAVITAAVCSGCHTHEVVSHSPPSTPASDSYSFSVPRSATSLRPGGGNNNVSLRAEPLAVVHSRTLTSYECVPTIAYYEKYLPWPQMGQSQSGDIKAV